MRTFVISLAALIVIAACGPGHGSEAEEARTDTTEAAPTEVTIFATDYAFEAPDTLEAGWTTFRLVNHGDEPHVATIVRLEDGRTMRDFISAKAEAERTRGPRPAWATYRGGPVGFTSAEAGVIAHLEPGNYAFLCFVPGPDGVSHLNERDQAHPFVVRPRTEDAPAASEPEPTVSLRMLDHTFQLSEPLEVGTQMIRVENAGVQPHHAMLFKLLPEKTFEDYDAWIGNNLQGDAPATFVDGMAELSTGAETYLEVDLTAGDYAFVCLVAGRDEVPHFEKGMIQHVRIE